jgi:hypothetical protein
MRQVAPWGKPVTNPGAFGLGADDETFGARLRMPGSTPDQVRLGNGDTPDLVTEEDIDRAQTTGASGSPWLEVLKNAAMVGVGGALVGYLATGGRGWRGAYIGATANVALFYFGTAFAGRKVLPASTTWTLAGLGVASAAGAGYFFMQQRRR